MIKVCHLLDNLNVGGLEEIAKEIALHLKGYEHKVLCLKKKGFLSGEIEDGGIEVVGFGFENSSALPCIRRLVKELKKEKFDIVHCYGLFPSMWGRIAAVFAGVPVKIIHCGNIYSDPSFKDYVKFKALTFFTDKIIAVADAVKRSLVEFLGISPDRIEVVHSGVEEFRAPSVEEKIEIRKGLGIKEEDFIIGTIGRLVEIKGHSYLLEAMAQLKAGGSDIKCLIVGYGPAMDPLKNMAEGLGLKGNIVFTGLRTDLDRMLSLMNIFVLPSIVREGLSLALAAAASAGLPLIATSVGGNSEIVLDSRNGFIVGPKDAPAIADKIRHLIDNPIERKRMGEESRKIWKAGFTSEEMLEKIGNIYRGLLLMKRIT